MKAKSLFETFLCLNLFVSGQWPEDLEFTLVVVLGRHSVNLLLGCTSGLNLDADLGPILALFDSFFGPTRSSFWPCSEFESLYRP